MLERWQRDDPTGQSFARREDLTTVQGDALVGKNANDRDWGKSRSLAYVRAYMNAMREFVVKRRGEFTAVASLDYLADHSDVFEAVNPASYLERVGGKAAALLEKKLDNALKEEGMSDDDIAQLNGPEKVTKLRDSIVTRTTIEASGSAAGLVPIKTFEAINCDGDSAIGVVLVYSAKMGRLATQISNESPISPDADRVGSAVRERLAMYSDEDLVTEFGVRRWWDEHGYPVILAFGQWGWYTANLSNRQKDRALRLAKDQAQIQATRYLTEFINIGTTFERISDQGSILEEARTRDSNGIVQDVDVEYIVDRVVATAQTKSEVDLTGLSILRTWSAPHPIAQDQELVGAVAYWSPAQEDITRKGLGLSTKHAPPKEESEPAAPQESKSMQSGTTESRVQVDASDF